MNQLAELMRLSADAASNLDREPTAVSRIAEIVEAATKRVMKAPATIDRQTRSPRYRLRRDISEVVETYPEVMTLGGAVQQVRIQLLLNLKEKLHPEKYRMVLAIARRGIVEDIVDAALRIGEELGEESVSDSKLIRVAVRSHAAHINKLHAKVEAFKVLRRDTFVRAISKSSHGVISERRFDESMGQVEPRRLKMNEFPTHPGGIKMSSMNLKKYSHPRGHELAELKVCGFFSRRTNDIRGERALVRGTVATEIYQRVGNQYFVVFAHGDMKMSSTKQAVRIALAPYLRAMNPMDALEVLDAFGMVLE